VGVLNVGDKAFAFKIITENDIKTFADVVGDRNPIHVDKDYAQKTIFHEPIAQGMLIGSLISGVLGTKLPGPGCIYLSQELKFLKPVKVNDFITANVEIIDIKHKRSGLIIVLKTWCNNQYEELVVNGEAVMKV
jgi:3-hydroxybutyryl-CoA dehydratase